MTSKNSPSLTSLRAFSVVGNCLSVTAAARQLGVTQSAVSRQIKALEAKIGALELPTGAADDAFEGGGKRRDEIEELASGSQNAKSDDQASLGDYQAGTERVERFMEEAARG